LPNTNFFYAGIFKQGQTKFVVRSTMFDLGSDDKKELQENMKEIKNLIDDEGKKRSQSKNSNQNISQGKNKGQKSKKTKKDQNQPSENKNAKLEDLNNNSNSRSNSSGNNLQRPQNQSSSPHEDKVINEEKSSSRASNSPSSNKGDNSNSKEVSHDEPLFLREEQFTDIREMVEEMSYLTQEMGQKVDRMKKTVRNERDISKDSEELVQAFTQRRSKIESTINSGQN